MISAAAPIPAMAPALALARAVHARAEQELQMMLADLGTLVDMDSPTYDLERCDAVARHLAGRVEAYGATPELVAGDNGLHMHAQVRGTGRARVALLCHHDTVFPAGTAESWGFNINGNRVTGPGVCDMKGGIVVAMHALRALCARPQMFAVVEMVCVPDEEERDGPPATLSRLHDFDAVLCMECGRQDGSIVSERKGGLWTKITAHGRAAHAGTEPDAGCNAVAALASEVLRIQALHRARPGLTAQVTRFTGGVGINTVPPDAELIVDVRASTEADLAWASEQLDKRQLRTPSDRIDLARTPAMERTPQVRLMATAAIVLGTAVGHSFGEASTGGTSDAAWTAGHGIPTLDGLGPVGGFDHTREEYAETATFATRCAVSAGLVAAINDGLLDCTEAAP